MKNRSIPGFLVAALSIACVPSRADACWCGYSATVGDISITEPMPNAEDCPIGWDPEVVREWAMWMVRLNKVLPPGMTLESFGGEAIVRTKGGRRVTTLAWGGPYGGELPRLFSALVRLGKNRGRVRAARELQPRVFTVQVLASRSEEMAAEVSARAERAGDVETGFFWAGEAPADNPIAHVVTETDANGRVLHKVMVGAFLERRVAEASARVIEQRTGLATHVRLL
jgi:hypothetical protein